MAPESWSMEELIQAVQDRRWSRDVDPPQAFRRVPTMLTPEELLMLSFMAEHAPEGPILDLGCFVGGSTLALAHGVRRSGSRRKHIHSFDLFELKEATKHRFLYDRGLPYFPGTDGLELFRIITRDVADIVSPTAGDILATLEPVLDRLEDPIGLVFLDLCKTPEITDHITRRVLAELQPGAWIVQQDFIYPYTPWAIHPLWALRNHLEFVGCTEKHSAVFRVASPLSDTSLEKALVAHRSAGEIAESVRQVRAWFDLEAQHLTLDKARQSITDFPQCRDEWSLMLACDEDLAARNSSDAWRRLDWTVSV